VRPLLRQTLLLLGLALLPAAGQALYFRDTVSWHSRVAESDMVAVEVARNWGSNAIWVDARADADFEREHVPGAILLNEDRWNELLPQFLEQQWSPEKKIVVYCSSQSCNLAGDVARRLREQAKLPNEIRVLKGGWEEWLKTRK
jgi:rhodanese-related sulfurtransferase